MSTYNPSNVVNNIAYPYGGARPRVADNSGYMAARASRDGSLYSVPWKQGLAFEGRVYHVDVGAVSTPIVGGGNGTVIDLEQPEFALSIPSGTSIMPLRALVVTKEPATQSDADVVEHLIAVDRTQTVNAGTSTTETIFNFRTDNGYSSLCTARSAYTGDMTVPSTPTLGIELVHGLWTAEVASAVAVSWTNMTTLYEPDTAPIIVGPASLYIYWGGTVATSGFASIEWAEFVTTVDITA